MPSQRCSPDTARRLDASRRSACRTVKRAIGPAPKPRVARRAVAAGGTAHAAVPPQNARPPRSLSRQSTREGIAWATSPSRCCATHRCSWMARPPMARSTLRTSRPSAARSLAREGRSGPAMTACGGRFRMGLVGGRTKQSASSLLRPSSSPTWTPRSLAAPSSWPRPGVRSGATRSTMPWNTAYGTTATDGRGRNSSQTSRGPWSRLASRTSIWQPSSRTGWPMHCCALGSTTPSQSRRACTICPRRMSRGGYPWPSKWNRLPTS